MSRSRRFEFDPRLRLSRRNQLTILGAALGVIVLVAAGVVGVGRLTAHAEPPTSSPDPGVFHPSSAQWATFAVEPVQSLEFQDEQETDGKIATNDNRTTPVFSPFTGRVTKVFVQEGEVVRKGQPLFAAQASEYVQAQNDLGAARMGEDTARAQLKTAEADEARLHELYQVDGASLKDWQQSQLALATAQGALRTAEFGRAAVRDRLRILGESDQAINALESHVSAHRIDPEATVYAPVDGTVVTRQVEPGQFLNSAANGAATAVLTISDLSTVWLVANVREADAGLVHLGDPMDVRVMAYPDRIFHAKVTFIAPSVDPATRRVSVRAEIANSDRLLKPEMFADFSITTGQASLSLALPDSAVVYEGQTAHVWLAKPDGSLALQQVRLGRSRSGFVEVLDGLSAGDRVATSSALFIDRAARSS